MLLVKRHQAPRLDEDLPAGGRFPEDLPVERSGAHVEGTLVAKNPRAAEIEWFVIQVQPDDLAVGDVHDRLAGGGEAEGAFTIRDGPGFVEAVDEGAVAVGRLPLAERSPHPEVPVGDGENGLPLGKEL